MTFRPFNSILWGTSIALSWMWGLGLFFSVQFTFQFGIFGLLSFAFTNALGLFLFGVATQYIANREPGRESLARYFFIWARPFRLVFFLYQLLAITLTIFALLRYLFQALHLSSPALVLPLAVLIILAAACLFGEEFNIRRIKYSHAIMFVILTACISILIGSLSPFLHDTPFPLGVLPTDDFQFWGYLIPICIGFLTGPWLDLQQWQRAIQIHREGGSVIGSYFVGSILFGCLLLFHGGLALWAIGQGAAEKFAYAGIDQLPYAHDMITRLLISPAWADNRLPALAYFVFLGICGLTTLDSGYLALKWFLKDHLKDYKNAILSLIPNSLLTSPIPSLIFGGLFSLFATAVGLELEYFMVFYATFFVGYSALAIIRALRASPADRIPQIRMFSVGSLAVVIFAFGYFRHEPSLLILASVLPLGYIFWLMTERSEAFEDENDEEADPSTGHRPLLASATTLTVDAQPVTSISSGSASEYFENKWFVHSFTATYADTNSTGNVYFGMYAMWVGKARELFFHKALPDFTVKTTRYFILTRSFEHKFIRETREFEKVFVKIRVADFNRKFVTMEHQIFDSANQLLGKGKQVLLFVSSKDYSLIDLPDEVYTGFIPYIPETLVRD